MVHASIVVCEDLLWDRDSVIAFLLFPPSLRTMLAFLSPRAVIFDLIAAYLEGRFGGNVDEFYLRCGVFETDNVATTTLAI